PAAPSPSKAPFPPQHPDRENVFARLWHHAINELTRRLLPNRKPRSNPRVVKRTDTRWPVKRARPRNWPQPTAAGITAVQIVP
ncbi:MAG: hypothetical protein ACK5KK_03135, partial [Microbacterium sp.]